MGPSINVVQGFFERYIQTRGRRWGVYKPEDITAQKISDYPKLKTVALCLRDLQETKDIKYPTDIDWLALHDKFKSHYDKEPKNTGPIGYLLYFVGKVQVPVICEYLHYAMSYISSEICRTASEDKTYHLDNFSYYAAGEETVFAHFADTFDDIDDDENDFDFCEKLMEVTKGTNLLNDSESKATPPKPISSDDTSTNSSSSASIAASLSVAAASSLTVASPIAAPTLKADTSSSSSAMMPSSSAESLSSSNSPVTPKLISASPKPSAKATLNKTKSGKRQFIPKIKYLPITGTSPQEPPPAFLNADSTSQSELAGEHKDSSRLTMASRR